MTNKGRGGPLEERLKTTKVSLTKTQLRVEVIELSILRLDGEQGERAEALLVEPKALCIKFQEGIEDIERLLQNANSEQRETLEANLVSLQQSIRRLDHIIELSEYSERHRGRERRYLKLNAAATLARFEYRFHLRITMLIVPVFLFFLGRMLSEQQDIVGQIMGSLFVGWGTAYVLRVSYFSRKLLKKYNEKQLREMWLSYAGLSDE